MRHDQSQYGINSSLQNLAERNILDKNNNSHLNNRLAQSPKGLDQLGSHVVSSSSLATMNN